MLNLYLPLVRRIQSTPPPNDLATSWQHVVRGEESILLWMPLGAKVGMQSPQGGLRGRDPASADRAAVASCPVLDNSLPLMRRIDSTEPPDSLAAERLHIVGPRGTVLLWVPLGCQIGM